MRIRTRLWGFEPRGRFQSRAGMFPAQQAPPGRPGRSVPAGPAWEAPESPGELGHGVMEDGEKALTK